MTGSARAAFERLKLRLTVLFSTAPASTANASTVAPQRLPRILTRCCTRDRLLEVNRCILKVYVYGHHGSLSQRHDQHQPVSSRVATAMEVSRKAREMVQASVTQGGTEMWLHAFRTLEVNVERRKCDV